MKSTLLAAFFANVATAIVSLWLLPARIPVHFGQDGAANGWARTDLHVLATTGLLALLLGLFLFSPRLLSVVSPRWINLPNKAYWLRADNTVRAQTLVATLMWEFGTAMFAYLLAIQILVIRANGFKPPRLETGLFLGLLAAFLLYTVYWCVKFYRRFRLPPGEATR